MREWCSCGAAIHATPRKVREWRDSHKHPSESPSEPAKQGSSAQVERSYQFDPNEIQVGFTRS